LQDLKTTTSGIYFNPKGDEFFQNVLDPQCLFEQIEEQYATYQLTHDGPRLMMVVDIQSFQSLPNMF